MNVVQDIMRQVKNQVTANLESLWNDIRAQSPGLLTQAFMESPTTQSIMHGVLEQEFGLSESDAVVQNIIQAVEQSFVFDSQPTVDGVVFVIRAFRSDFTDALSSRFASYVSVNRKGRQSLVEWLDWLLFGGSSAVVVGYNVKMFNKTVRGSRAGHAVMAGSGTKNLRVYSVNDEFAGTANHNWLTQVASAFEILLISEIETRVATI